MSPAALTDCAPSMATTTASDSIADVKSCLLDRASAEIERMKRRIRAQDALEAANNNNDSITTITTLRSACSSSNRRIAPALTTTTSVKKYHSFPSGCLSYLLSHIEGNHVCVDCGQRNPEWAAVSYGALLCLQCSGHHRSLGVQTSKVLSLYMDEWSLDQVVKMLEGGNAQLLGFFQRHALCQETILLKNKQQQQQRRQAGGDPASLSPTQTMLTTENVTRLRYKTKAALFYRQQLSVHVSKVLVSQEPYKGREMSRKAKHNRLDHRNSSVE